MPPIADGTTRGLHLGWIPNEPGRRPRDYPEQPPKAPDPDPDKVRRVQEGQHSSGMRRVLIVTGLLALLLFGGLGALAHRALFWEVAAGIVIVFWLSALTSAVTHRRAVRVLEGHQALLTQRHGLSLATHARSVAAWQAAEAERVAGAPHWLRVASSEAAGRLDVFGGTAQGRRGMLAGLGISLLDRHAVIVLDLSQERVCEGLLDAARQAGISCHDYRLPAGLGETPLLGGLTAEQLASQVVEVLYADDPSATAAGRATDLMVLRKVIGSLGDDVTMARIHEALLGDLSGVFPDSFRHEVAGSLVRLAAVIEPLRDLGTAATPRPPARLTCLSVEEGPRDVTNDLTAALVVQWATQAIIADGAGDRGGAGDRAGRGNSSGDGGPRPAVILAGADEQAARHLQRLTAVCGRYGVPLIRTFSRLSEESARHLDTRNTAFMKLATRTEALRAAEHIGLERKFVAGRFTQTRSVSKSRTRTTAESFTHTAGYAQGEAVTKTTGTTEGESLSESVVQRHNDRAHGDRPRDDGHSDNGKRQGASGSRKNVSGDPRQAKAASGHAASDEVGGGQDFRDRSLRDKNINGRVDASKEGKARPERVPGGGRTRPGASSGGGRGGKHQPYVFDFITSRTKYRFTHQSEAKTESWTRSEESSHTQTTELSRTDGTSVGDEITYELTYDHKVAPETLMDLPEDQMLAPHVVEGRTLEGSGAEGITAGPVESKMIALVVNPEIIGSATVAYVQPSEIPAFQPPPPIVRPHVPDSLKALRPAGE